MDNNGVFLYKPSVYSGLRELGVFLSNQTQNREEQETGNKIDVTEGFAHIPHKLSHHFNAYAIPFFFHNSMNFTGTKNLLRLDENIAAQDHMLAAYPNLQAMYKPGDGNTAVFYLKNAVATICSFTEPAKTINF